MPETVLGVENVAEQDIEAYKINYEAHRKGISTEECIAYYDKIAADYEKNLNPSRYSGYVIAADIVNKYRDHEKSVKIIDVGCGTGLLGEQLRHRGFTNVDGLEPSSKMAQLAANKSVYRHIYPDILDGSQTAISDDSYDVLVLSGAMGEGHIPCNGLCEMIRIVKPDGLVIIVMQEEYLEYVMEYKNRLEPYMKELEESGQWRLLERTIVSKYSFGKNGVIFIFQVLRPGFKPIESHILTPRNNF